MTGLGSVIEPDLAHYSTGLRAGFRIQGGRTMRRLTPADLHEPIRDDTWTWVHVDLVEAGLPALLSRIPGIEPELLALLDAPEGPPRIEPTEGGLWGMLPDFEARPEPDEKHMSSLRFVLVGRLLVTGRRHPLHVTGTLIRGIDGHHDLHEPISVLVAQLRGFASIAHAQALRTGRTLDAIEDGLLGGRPVDRARLQSERRRIIRLARRVLPLRQALDENAELLADALRSVERVASELEGLNDRARLLHEDLMGRIAEDTNQRLYVISMITALLVPPTLVTGFFGMNTGGLPFTEGAHGTWFALALAALACGTAAWLLLRRP